MRAVLITCTAILLVAGTASAEIPQYTSYQGRVTDNSGVPVADGTYNMRFRIYDAETGGTMEWDSGTHSEQVEGGVFNVLLGESPHPALDLDFDEDYWLLVTFDGVNQTPRQRLTSAGYAYMASGLVPGTEVEGAVSGGGAIEGYNTATTGNAYGGIFDVGPGHAGGYGAGVLARNNGSTGDDNYGGLLMSWGLTGTGVKGWALATTGVNYGVYGQSDSDDGRGVYGEAPEVGVEGYASATTDDYAYGGWFKSASNRGSGVRGYATSTAGTYATYGVCGRSYATTEGSAGVYGISSYNNNYGATYGVYGRTDGRNDDPQSLDPVGVYGLQSSTASTFGLGGYFRSFATQGVGLDGTGTYVGVRAYASNGYGLVSNVGAGSAGYFFGDVEITGTLSKGGGSFLIDHPLDPENKLLRHNFVESPENLVIYRGTVKFDSDGEAVVELPEYFEALTRENEATVHLTPEGRPFLTGYRWQADHTAFSAYGDANREAAWMVMADRDDPVIHQLARPVEEAKGPENKVCDKGELLYPTAYGYPETMGKSHKILRRGSARLLEEPEDLRPTAAVERVEPDRTSDDEDVMEVSDAR
jgi:hypothetical protein